MAKKSIAELTTIVRKFSRWREGGREELLQYGNDKCMPQSVTKTIAESLVKMQGVNSPLPPSTDVMVCTLHTSSERRHLDKQVSTVEFG